jgi:hypothetical protein
MGQIMMCTPYMSNYYLWEFFIEIIDNKKLEEYDGADDDVYILNIKRYGIRTCSWLGRWCDIWWCVHVAYKKSLFKNT